MEGRADRGKLAASPGGGNFVLRGRLRRLEDMATVSRRDRLTDLVGLAIILAGIALYLDAGARLRTISGYSYQNPMPYGQSALAAADSARRESYSGLALAVLGCGVGVFSALRHARRGRPVLS